MGFVVSALTLADALVKLARFGSMIKDAPGVWREYSSALDGIVRVSAGIDAVSQNLPVSNLTVEVEGQQQNLIKLCNRNVDKVVQDVQSLLKGFSMIEKTSGRKHVA
ncbi:hypothetical protein ACJ41O_013018 [Fusarium nematophilum]